jgi:hypothetical protein
MLTETDGRFTTLSRPSIYMKADTERRVQKTKRDHAAMQLDELARDGAREPPDCRWFRDTKRSLRNCFAETIQRSVVSLTASSRRRTVHKLLYRTA